MIMKNMYIAWALLVSQGLLLYGSDKNNMSKYRQMHSHILSSSLATICAANERFFTFNNSQRIIPTDGEMFLALKA